MKENNKTYSKERISTERQLTKGTTITQNDKEIETLYKSIVERLMQKVLNYRLPNQGKQDLQKCFTYYALANGCLTGS